MRSATQTQASESSTDPLQQPPPSPAARAAARDWSQDQEFYARLKLLTVCVRSRQRELPEVDEAMYQDDLALYG